MSKKRPEFEKLRSDFQKVKKEISKIEQACELMEDSDSEKEQEEIWKLAREHIYDLRFCLNVFEFSLHNSKKLKK